MNTDAAQLAEMLDVPLRTAQRWVQLGRMPRPYARIYAALCGGLGALWPKWNGVRMRADQVLVSRHGGEVTDGQVDALPYLISALAAHQTENRKLREQITQMATVTRLERTDAPRLGSVTIEAAALPYSQPSVQANREVMANGADSDP